MQEQFRKNASTKVSVLNTSTAVLVYNGDRGFAKFSNDSNEAIYLAFGEDAVINQGIRLAPADSSSSSFELNNVNLYKGAVNAICSTGGKNLCVLEGEDKYQ